MNKSRILIILFLITVIGVSATDIFISSLPQMVTDFNSNKMTINATILIFSIGMALAVLYSGVLSGRFGRRKLLLIALFCFAWASLFIVFSKNLTLLLTLRFIQGVCSGLWMVTQRLILKDIMDEKEQLQAGALLVVAQVASPALAPILGAYLAHLWNWRACFMFSSIAGFMVLVAIYRYIPETNKNFIARLPPLKEYLLSYVHLLSDSLFINLIIINSLVYATYFAFIGVSSYLYIEHFGLSPISYSYLFLFITIGNFIGNSYMMFLNKNDISVFKIISSGVKLNLIGALVLLIAILGYSNFHLVAFIAITIGSVIARFASALVINPVQIKVMNHFQEKGATALGITTCAQFAAGGIAAVIVGVFSQKSLLIGFILLTNLFAAGTYLSLKVLKKNPEF